MRHERFDLKHWVDRFPLAASAGDGSIGTLSGPRAVAYVEQLRADVRRRGGDLGRAVPADLCVWANGDGGRSDATRIGGVPYWPAGEPWPELEGGEPLTFVAQLSFADSLDILPPLPGNLLSIFAAGDDYMDLVVTWLETGDGGDAMPPSDMPSPSWAIAPLHAQLHRTFDYPDADYDLFEGYGHPLSSWAKVLDECTKLGGAGRLKGELPQPAEFPPDSPSRRSIEESWARRRKREQSFIGQIRSVTAWGACPFINADVRPADAAARLLSIGDLGGYDFFQDGEETDLEWCSG